MIQSYILLGTLGVHSIEDIREKKITVPITLFSAVLGIVLHLIYQRESIFAMLAGILPGIFILGLSRMTRGQIGMGDGMVFMLTGLYLGLVENLLLMCISFFLAGIWGLFRLVVCHCSKNERMPFLPFLFFGYLLMMIG